MKRAIAVLLLVMVTIMGVSAATDVDVALNLKNNFFNFGFDVDDGESRFNTPKIGINVDGTFIFDKHNGFYLDLGFSMEDNTFAVGSGYAYTDPLSNSMDMILSVGPHFLIKTNSLEIGMDFAADFKLAMTQSMFFRFGGGISADFVTVEKNNNRGYLHTNFMIPRIAIGWSF